MMTREEAIEVLRRTTEYFKKDKDFRFREAVETLVPEFNETEDERIRKELIEFLREAYSRGNAPEECAKWLVWLDLSKEQKDPQTQGIEIGKSYKCIASPRFTCFRKGEVYVVEDEWMAKLFSVSEGCFEAVEDPKEQKPINESNMHEPTLDEARKWNEAYEKGYSLGYENGRNERKPILEVFGFKVGDAVRLKDGDGRKHIIKSFEEVEGVHGPNFYHVEFEDNSARDGIYPGEEYPNGYYTQMEKIEEEQKPVWSEEDEKMRELLIAIFETNHPNGFFKANETNTIDMRGVHTEEIVSWLKSLRKNRKACDVDEFSLTLRNCLYVDSELTHEQADIFARAYGEELYKVALGEINTGLDKEDIEEYKFNPKPGDTRDRKSVEWDEDELSRYALTKAYEAYPMSVRNICNNEWNAKRDGYRHGYEQAVKELSLPKPTPNKEGC